MNLFMEFFKEDLVFSNEECIDQQDCFNKISDKLFEKGLVRASFASALKEREDLFPTGLDADPYHVAIPHTDPEHVIKPFVAILKPKNTVQFITMGSEENEIDASIIFVLGITEPASQVVLLQNLIEIFRDKQLMGELLDLNDSKAIYSLLKNNITIEGGVNL